MRPIALLSTALAALSTACGTTNCPDNIGDETPADSMIEVRPNQLGLQANHRRLAQKFGVRAGEPYTPVSTRNNKCIDVRDNNLGNGGKLQLWDCSNGRNQQWRIEGPLFQTNNDVCLDVPSGNAYNGAKLQVWKCDGQNRNQHWERNGDQLRFKNSNFCLDLTGGNANNGQELQMWTCYPGSQNQAWNFAGQSSQPAAPQPANNGGATTWLGHQAISIDDFCAKHPECAPYKSAFTGAAQDQQLNPTFLASIAMIESGCSPYPAGPNGRFGPFQFMDDRAWSRYGFNKDRTNFWDAAYGAARYFRDLLNNNGNNLHEAMRSYNGPLEYGGEPNYQSWAYTWMSGGSPR